MRECRLPLPGPAHPSESPLTVAFDAQTPQLASPCPSLLVTLQDPSGSVRSELAPGHPFECVAQGGIWRLGIAPRRAQESTQPCRLELQVEGADPFIVPGPGVIPSHFRQGRPFLLRGRFLTHSSNGP